MYKCVYPDGNVKYKETHRTYCADIEDLSMYYFSSLIQCIYDEMYPIVMPYIPADRKDVTVCKTLTDPKNGAFDTIAILYVKRSNGEKVDINRYFKETDNGFIEISEEEYREREKMDEERRKLTEE